MRRRAVSLPFFLPLAIGLFVRCGPSGSGSPTELPAVPDPADAPRLAGVSPGAVELRIEAGDRVEFHVEATSPRSLPLSTTFLVDGIARTAAPTFVFEPERPGHYLVAAVVTDGELSTTREWTVDVDAPPPVNIPPNAVLGVEPGSGIAPLAARFRVQGDDPDGTVVRWRLELLGPDPVIVVRSAPIDTILVLGAGTWQATAIVEDDAGATTAASRPVPVAAPNQPPVARLRVEPATGPAPLDALVEAEGDDPDGSVARYRLDLDGDGAFEIDGPTPLLRSVRFERPGTRWVRLAVVDDRGAEARDSVSVRVTDPAPAPPPEPPANAPPVVALTVSPTTGDAPLEVAVHAAGSDPDGAVVAIRIDVDGKDPPEAEGTGPGLDATILFATPGTWTIRATVVDDDGAAGAATAAVTVRAASNQPPTGSLALGPTSGDAPLEVLATASGSDPDGLIVKWEIEPTEGDGFVELDASHAARLVYGFDPNLYRPRLRLTDDAGAVVVVTGPPVTVYRPVGGGGGSVAGNPHFDATGIAPAVWSTGADPWRLAVTVVTPDAEPLAGVPLRFTVARPTLSAPDGTSLGPGATLASGAPVTGAGGAATASLVTTLSTRIEVAPVIGFRGFDVVVEADAGHGQWRLVTRLEGLNANSTVAAADTRLILHPSNAAVCPGTPVEIEVQARNRSDAPAPGSAAAGRYTVLRTTDGAVLPATPLPGYGSWRTDAAGILRFSYTPTPADQGRLVQAWVDGQPIDELVVLAIEPASRCPD